MTYKERKPFKGQRPKGVLRPVGRPGLEISFKNVPNAGEKMNDGDNVWASNTEDGRFIGLDLDRGVKLGDDGGLTFEEMTHMTLAESLREKLKMNKDGS